MAANPRLTPAQQNVYIVTKLEPASAIGIAGLRPTRFENDGVIGFMLVFDDYNKALDWAGGRADLVLPGTTEAGREALKQP